jgi:RND superfamily putative drug exporter
MHLFGNANWWLPRWIDRRLPHLAIEPPDAAGEPAHPLAPVIR